MSWILIVGSINQTNQVQKRMNVKENAAKMHMNWKQSFPAITVH
jgi:hypothetical protein